jgi:hypothetical protein
MSTSQKFESGNSGVVVENVIIIVLEAPVLTKVTKQGKVR